MRYRTIALILTVLAALVAAPAVATAQESAGDAYGGQGEVAGSVSEPPAGEDGTGSGASVSGEDVDDGDRGDIAAGAGPSASGGDDGTPTAAPAPSASASAGSADQVGGSELPFTGFDAALVGVGGLLLVALGLGVRRLSRDPAASA